MSPSELTHAEPYLADLGAADADISDHDAWTDAVPHATFDRLRRENPVAWIDELMQQRDRTLAADTAPADGLYLMNIDYPAEFGLPATPPGPWFLAE